MPRPTSLPDLRFLVVGADKAGKTSFIHHALDLKKTTSSPTVASKKMSLEGAVFLINLLETDLDEVEVDDDLSITWPASSIVSVLGDPATSTTQVDGVLALYDVSHRASLTGIPDLLSKFI
jgi:GTPase SAR1 family protein